MALFRRKPTPPTVPTWCSWFGIDDWTAFRELVADMVRDEQGNPVTIGEEPVVSLSSQSGGSYQLDVSDLARWLQDLSHERWPDTIRKFIAQGNESADEWRTLRSVGFDQVRPLLLPRVSRAEDLRNEGTLIRDLGADLIAALCVRGGHDGFPVGRSLASQWGVDDAELWTIALDNLRREPHDLSKAVREDRPVYMLVGDTWYTSANLLRLDELIDEPAPHGMLVIAPSFNALGFWVIPDIGVANAMFPMQKLGRDLWKKVSAGDWGLSPDLFWWSDGRLDIIKMTKNNDGSTTASSSARFMDMINLLAKQFTPAPDRP
jgi:hypothetical protein